MSKVDSIVPDTAEGDVSFPTDKDLSSYQYRFVKRDATDGKIDIATANDKTAGILQNAPDGSSSDAVAIVRTYGLSKLKINEAVSPGNFLTPTSVGRGEICDAANEEFGAVAMSDGAAQDDIIPVLIQHGEVTATDA